MAGTITSMSKIKQVLIMHKQGMSNRDIAKEIKIDKGTVNDYMRKVRLDPLGIDELLKLEDPELEGRLFAGNPAYTDKRMDTFLKELPYFREQLAIPHVTRFLLWEEYMRKHPDGYGKSQFFFHLKQNLVVEKTPVGVLKNLYEPGKELFVDFAGDPLSYVDPGTGEEIKVQVFVATLPYTDYAYALCIESQKVEDFLHCIRMCLEHLGGVPKIIVSDNLKSAVIKPDTYEPSLNKAFEDMGNHYNFAIIPARSLHPKDKALVESTVSRVYHRVYAKLRNRQFYSLKELNDAVAKLLLEYNRTRKQLQPFSREEHFHTTEKSALQPLPDSIYEMKCYSHVTVKNTGEVYLSCDKHFYTVPYEHTGRKATIIYTRSLVKVYVDNKSVTIIERDRTPGGHTQLPEHLHPNVKAYLDRSPESYCEKAKHVSEPLEKLFQSMFYNRATGVNFDVYYRSCEKMLSLQKKTDSKLFDRACDVCRINQIYRGDGLESVISAIGKNIADEDAETSTVIPTNHENTRGSAQYK
jgi:transposase